MLTKDAKIDIGSNLTGPAGVLSNFSPHPFVLKFGAGDTVYAKCMEAFLQSLKCRTEYEAEIFRGLEGPEAKSRGGELNRWQMDQNLHFMGTIIPRNSWFYQLLLMQAFHAMFEQNKGFRKALEATGHATLHHSIGSDDKSKTVLTRAEFIMNLVRLRDLVVPPDESRIMRI